MEIIAGIRTKYITQNERALLISLIEERKSVLSDKSHDIRIIQKKKEAWQEVTNHFNASFASARTMQQLKKIWENFKGKAKKGNAIQSQRMKKTGDGPKPVEDDTDQAKILSITADELLDLGNELDSNTTTTSKAPLPVSYVDGKGHGYAMEECARTSFSTPAFTPSTSGSCATPSTSPQSTTAQSSAPATSAPSGKPHCRAVKFTHEAAYEASLSMLEKEHEKNMRLMDLEEQINMKKLELLKYEEKISIKKLKVLP